MESDHQVAKGFWLTFGGGTLIAVLLVAVFVWADSTGSSGGEASASPATTSAPATTETSAASTPETAASTEETTETSSTEEMTETSETSTATTTMGGGTASIAAGKKVFTTNCGACHALADAGTSGNVGPNLDDLKPDTATVQHQVENGGGGMPAFGGQLKPAQIEAVAEYVSSVAGKGG